jgi:hypothetical protein
MGNPSAASNALGIIAHGPASAGVAGSSQSTRSLASYRVSPREGVYPYDIPYDSACFRGGAGGDVDAFIGGGDANGRPPRHGVAARASSARAQSAPFAFDASLSARANVGIAAKTIPSPVSPARAFLFVGSGVAVDAPLPPSRASPSVFPRAGVSNAPAGARTVGGDANDASAVTRRRFASASILRRRRRFKFSNFAASIQVDARDVESTRGRPGRRCAFETVGFGAVSEPRRDRRDRRVGGGGVASRDARCAAPRDVKHQPHCVYYTRVSEHIPIYRQRAPAHAHSRRREIYVLCARRSINHDRDRAVTSRARRRRRHTRARVAETPTRSTNDARTVGAPRRGARRRARATRATRRDRSTIVRRSNGTNGRATREGRTRGRAGADEDVDR